MNNIPASDLLLSDITVQQFVEIVFYLLGTYLGFILVCSAFIYLIFQVISLILSLIRSHRKSLDDDDDLYKN